MGINRRGKQRSIVALARAIETRLLAAIEPDTSRGHTIEDLAVEVDMGEPVVLIHLFHLLHRGWVSGTTFEGRPDYADPGTWDRVHLTWGGAAELERRKGL